MAYKDATTNLAGRLLISDTCGKVELLENEAVIEELKIEPLPKGVTHYLCVSYDGTTLRADVAPAAASSSAAAGGMHRHVAHAATADPDGVHVAVGTGANSGTVTFEVSAEIPYHPTLYPSCSTCDTCALADVVGTDPAALCLWNPVSGTVVQATSGVRISTLNGYAALKGNDGASNSFVSAILSGTVSGQTLRVYINDDATLGGPWVELEFKNAPQTTVMRASTGQTAIYPIRPNESHSLAICLDGTGLTGNLDRNPSGSPALAASVRGTLAAAATGKYLVCQLLGAAGDAYFEHVTYSRLSIARPMSSPLPAKCAVCYAACDCCQNGIMPTELLLEVEGLVPFPPTFGSPCCPNYNNAYFVEPFITCHYDWNRGAIDPCNKPGIVSVSFQCLADTIRISANLYYQTNYPFPGAFLLWQTSVPLPANCLSFNRLQLHLISHTGTNMRCDPSNSFAYLTSL